LTSDLGQALNGRVGTVIRWDHFAGRIGVKIDGVDDGAKPKAIKLRNLQLVSRPLLISDDLDEDIETQLAIEASVKTKVLPVAALCGEPSSVNAQLSDAILRSQKGLTVVLFTLSRCPQALFSAFDATPKLADCKKTMEEHDLSWKINVGTKHGPFVFVSPDRYKPLQEALRLNASAEKLEDFRSSHVFADEELSDDVLKAINGLPRREKVQAHSVSIVPLSFAAGIVEHQIKASILKTFIDIKESTSLHSLTEGGPHTVSTTDADSHKKGVVHRPCAKSKRH